MSLTEQTETALRLDGADTAREVKMLSKRPGCMDERGDEMEQGQHLRGRVLQILLTQRWLGEVIMASVLCVHMWMCVQLHACM